MTELIGDTLKSSLKFAISFKKECGFICVRFKSLDFSSLSLKMFKGEHRHYGQGYVRVIFYENKYLIIQTNGFGAVKGIKV